MLTAVSGGRMTHDLQISFYILSQIVLKNLQVCQKKQQQQNNEQTNYDNEFYTVCHECNKTLGQKLVYN